MSQISIRQLFEENQNKLALKWVAGQDGGNRTLTGESALHNTIGQLGHMNFVHPFRIQILGSVELAYLDGLSEEEFQQCLKRLFSDDLAAIIIANNGTVPRDLTMACSKAKIALFTSSQPSPHIVDVLRLYLAKVLAKSVMLHGVFLDVLGMGILITGASAIGKSELALELVSRGHGLIADDIVEFFRISPETLEGRCPPLLKDFLEVRGIGVLNIRTIFGETAVRPKMNLKLIVHLENYSDTGFSKVDRLQINTSTQEILGVNIRRVLIPVAVGRNLAVLVEAAVRNHILQLRGIDSTREFIDRQQKLLDAQEAPE